jgi:hypothetical protein
MALHYLPEWSPLPITTRDGEKVLLVKGVSGGHEKYADERDVREWIHQPHLAAAGIALRLPKNVIGIDLDCYGDKAGRRTFAALQGKWGRLEPTWITTARDDGSGIRLYRIEDEHIPAVDRMRDPRGNFPDGDALGGIEIIRWRHRYATVWPTWHGGVGATYRWVTPDGEDSQEWPLPEDLPLLPASWVEGLSTGRDYATGHTELTGSPSDWLRARPGGDGELCGQMQRDLSKYVSEVRDTSQGCYPAACRGVLALVGNAAEGHRGALPAVEALWVAYRDAMNARQSGGRSAAVVESEFNRALVGAIQKLPARKFHTEDVCDWKLP